MKRETRHYLKIRQILLSNAVLNRDRECYGPMDRQALLENFLYRALSKKLKQADCLELVKTFVDFGVDVNARIILLVFYSCADKIRGGNGGQYALLWRPLIGGY